MKYAIINLSGKQYKVKAGDIIETERLNFKPEEKVSFDDVLLVVSNDKVVVGTPKVDSASVKATILTHAKGEKVRIAKFKAKTRYRRVTGKRQSLTKVKIEEIVTREKQIKPERKPKSKKRLQ